MDEDDIFTPDDEDIESPFLADLFDDELEYEQREDMSRDDDDFGIGGIPAY